MKIGIVTVYESITNLGSFLQTYAMKTLLTELGHEVYILQNVKTSESVKKCVLKLNPKREFFLRFKKASKFLTDMKNFSLLPKEKVNSSNIDLLLYGSDEIWNLDNKYFCDEFFVGGGYPDIRKIGFAVSVGAMSEKTIANNYNLLSNINNLEEIYVRDERTFDVVKRLTGTTPKIVSDPTLILDLPKMTKKVKIPKEPYLLVYSYGIDKELEEKVVHFARKNNLKIVSACFWHLWADQVIECESLQFSYLIEHAKYVFTTTFHGAIFTLLNKKKCVIYPTREKVANVVCKYGMEKHLIDDNTSYIDFEKVMLQDFDKEEFDKKLNEYKEKSLNLLKEAINNVE